MSTDPVSAAANMPELANAPSMEERIACMVFKALQKELVSQVQSQVQAGLADIQAGLASLATSVSDTQGGLEALAGRVADVGVAGCGTGPRPSVSPLEKYDGISKTLTDQFVRQVEAAAEFEVFWDDHQKILWAQSYLTGSAQAWSCVITTGLDDAAANP
ncbi:hypothetical protein C0992_011375 [Termitomyces sp. T32_za158]|nr:hypothetical protein C0992_011375 [Termitomyces sp. T32_za158]